MAERQEKMKQKTDFFRGLFREYDIRGRVRPGEMDRTAVLRIARGFSRYLRRRGVQKVVVGYDNRRESPFFARLAAETLAEQGFLVYQIGLCITPAAYFAQYYYEAPGVMMITASHNPKGWCGCKLGDGFAKTLGPSEIQELYEDCRGETAAAPRAGGALYHVSIREAYLRDLVEQAAAPANSLRVVVDAGNGAAGIYAWELFQRLGYLTFPLHCEPDPDYPHYFPNPSEKTAREALKQAVTTVGIDGDIGLAFDGDGDRLGVVDGRGQDVWADRVLMILARDYLKKYPGSSVVFDVKCSRALPETIAAAGGNAIMWKTGHSYIKAKMKETKAVLGGERSGHIFFNDRGRGYDDALLAGASLLRVLAEKGQSLETMLDAFPSYETSSEIRIASTDEKKYLQIQQLQQYFVRAYGEGRVCRVNGARVDFPQYGGWALVRASSNLPELVVVAEASDRENLQNLKAEFQRDLVKNGITEPWQNQ